MAEGGAPGTSAAPLASTPSVEGGTAAVSPGASSEGPPGDVNATASGNSSSGLGGQAAADAGTKVKAAKGDVSFALVGTAGGIPNVDNVLRTQVMPALRTCYKKSLATDPAQSGELVVAMQVDSSGPVSSSRTVVNRGIGEAVEKCSVTLSGHARFHSFGGDAGKSTATLSVRLTFK
jgi:hypothetical protein